MSITTINRASRRRSSISSSKRHKLTSSGHSSNVLRRSHNNNRHSNSNVLRHNHSSNGHSNNDHRHRHSNSRQGRCKPPHILKPPRNVLRAMATGKNKGIRMQVTATIVRVMTRVRGAATTVIRRV